jgi:DNA ligase-1
MKSYAFSELVGTDKSDRCKIWNAAIHEQKDHVLVTISYGLVDGKQNVTTRSYNEGKNIGKANERTVWEQAYAETLRKWKDKKEKEGYHERSESEKEKEGYHERSEPEKETLAKKDMVTPVLPMLAATYDHKMAFPCFVQPKLDGLRCLTFMKDGKVVAQSRTGGLFSMGRVTHALLSFFKEYPMVVLDGELYTPDLSFERVAGLIKKKKRTPDDDHDLSLIRYHIYDCIPTTSMSSSFSERIAFLNETVHLRLDPILALVSTERIESDESFRSYFSSYIEAGFEGIMLRTLNGVYRTGYRSKDLQKYKEFQEEEFKIIGYDQGTGRDEGTVIWLCETELGKPFSVRPRGKMELRKEWYKNGPRYVGKKLTVIFQERSEQGVPRFPVGKAVRDGY